MALMGFILVLATLDLLWTIATTLSAPPYLLVTLESLLDLFGMFLLVLVGLELLDTIKAYVQEHVVHAEITERGVEVPRHGVKVAIVEPTRDEGCVRGPEIVPGVRRRATERHRHEGDLLLDLRRHVDRKPRILPTFDVSLMGQPADGNFWGFDNYWENAGYVGVRSCSVLRWRPSAWIR